MFSDELTEILDKIFKNQEKLESLLKTRERPFISLKEAASYLSLPTGTVYNYTHRGILPHYKLNKRRLYFNIQDLDNFILNRENRVRSQEEIEQEAIDNF